MELTLPLFYRPQNPFLGIEKLIDTPDFVVYPNPFQASFILETKNAFTGQLALADIQGKTCFVKKVENQQTVTIDELSMYPAGLYFLSLQDANGIRNFKIIKY